MGRNRKLCTHCLGPVCANAFGVLSVLSSITETAAAQRTTLKHREVAANHVGVAQGLTSARTVGFSLLPGLVVVTGCATLLLQDSFLQELWEKDPSLLATIGSLTASFQAAPAPAGEIGAHDSFELFSAKCFEMMHILIADKEPHQ